MNRMCQLLGALIVVLSTAGLATAGDGAAAAAIGMGLSIIGIGIGLGLAGFGALSGMARQPEMKGDLQNVMLIAGGLVEGAGIIALILCFVTVLMLK